MSLNSWNWPGKIQLPTVSWWKTLPCRALSLCQGCHSHKPQWVRVDWSWSGSSCTPRVPAIKVATFNGYSLIYFSSLDHQPYLCWTVLGTFCWPDLPDELDSELLVLLEAILCNAGEESHVQEAKEISQSIRIPFKQACCDEQIVTQTLEYLAPIGPPRL